jgi:hypothetical protein
MDRELGGLTIRRLGLGVAAVAMAIWNWIELKLNIRQQPRLLRVERRMPAS